jgi:hypothetical protein
MAGIGKFIMEHQAAGKSDQDILVLVKASFPDAKTSISSIKWYRSQGNKDRSSSAKKDAAPRARTVTRVTTDLRPRGDGRLPRPPVAGKDRRPWKQDPSPAEVAAVATSLRGSQPYHLENAKTFRNEGGPRLWTADLVHRGVTVARVSNLSGMPPYLYEWEDRDGPRVRVLHTAWAGGITPDTGTAFQQAWLEHCASLPKVNMPGRPGASCFVEPDVQLERLLEDAVLRRRLDNLMGEKVVWLMPGDRKLHTASFGGDGPGEAEVVTRVKAKYPQARVLNEMDVDDAVRTMR